MSDDVIPVVETYRGIGIHDCQPSERIEAIVKPEIDRVLDELHDAELLYDFARSVWHCPEARWLARIKLIAMVELAAEGREKRPNSVFVEKIKAATGGLNKARLRNRYYYCGGYDVWGPGARRPMPREEPLSRP